MNFLLLEGFCNHSRINSDNLYYNKKWCTEIIGVPACTKKKMEATKITWYIIGKTQTSSQIKTQKLTQRYPKIREGEVVWLESL